jgi:hypothetical protein
MTPAPGWPIGTVARWSGPAGPALRAECDSCKLMGTLGQFSRQHCKEKLMKAFACFLLLLGLALSAAAADVTGNWSGSFNMTGPGGESKESEALLVLKQNGSEITGSVGPNENERHTIAKGKIEGDKITLETSGDNGPVIKFVLVLEGEHIKGDATAEHDGQTLKAKLDLTRGK